MRGSCSLTMGASGLCPLPFLAATACPVLDTGVVSLWTPFALPFPLLLPFLLKHVNAPSLVSFL